MVRLQHTRIWVAEIKNSCSHLRTFRCRLMAITVVVWPSRSMTCKLIWVATSICTRQAHQPMVRDIRWHGQLTPVSRTQILTSRSIRAVAVAKEKMSSWLLVARLRTILARQSYLVSFDSARSQSLTMLLCWILELRAEPFCQEIHTWTLRHQTASQESNR